MEKIFCLMASQQSQMEMENAFDTETMVNTTTSTATLGVNFYVLQVAEVRVNCTLFKTLILSYSLHSQLQALQLSHVQSHMNINKMALNVNLN